MEYNNTDNNTIKRCILLDIEMPLDRICPASKKLKKRFCCYKDCGFSSARDKNKIIKKKKVHQLELTNFDGFYNIKDMRKLRKEQFRLASIIMYMELYKNVTNLKK